MNWYTEKQTNRAAKTKTAHENPLTQNAQITENADCTLEKINHIVFSYLGKNVETVKIWPKKPKYPAEGR